MVAGVLGGGERRHRIGEEGPLRQWRAAKLRLKVEGDGGDHTKRRETRQHSCLPENGSCEALRGGRSPEATAAAAP